MASERIIEILREQDQLAPSRHLHVLRASGGFGCDSSEQPWLWSCSGAHFWWTTPAGSIAAQPAGRLLGTVGATMLAFALMGKARKKGERHGEETHQATSRTNKAH